MKRRLCVQWGLVTGVVLLGGCASVPSGSGLPHHWAGRLVLQIQDGPEQRHSGGFELHGSPTEGELNLFNPLGTTVAQARWTPNLAQLQQGQNIQWFDTPSALVHAATGADLPLEALFDWLKGIPTSAAGWQVDLAQYTQGRIRAQRSQPTPAVQLLIVLQQP
ncbi:outer membrane lipoprotein LolB [Arthrospira platensis SPKY1]|nr:outer membrane lipoprotein LolB [Arthrospira platensis SPKY1]